MELLQEIQTSSTRKSPFAEAALQKLLDSNLSAKYALTGILSELQSYIIVQSFINMIFHKKVLERNHKIIQK